MDEITQIREQLTRLETMLRELTESVTAKAATAEPADEVMTAEELAAYLGVTKGRVYHLTSAKDLPHYRRNGKIYFSKAEIDDWKLGRRVRTNEEIKKEGERRAVTDRVIRASRAR